MKLSFEGQSLDEIVIQMKNTLTWIRNSTPPQQLHVGEKIEKVEISPVPEESAAEVQGPGPEPVENPPPAVDKPVEKVRSPQIEKMLAAKAAKAKARKEADDAKALGEATKVVGASTEELLERVAKETAAEAAAPPIDPAEAVRLRQRTIEDLQSAYANGHQKEVFELLSRFGNGAKSFRELQPEAFVPIRKAIDNGALT